MRPASFRTARSSSGKAGYQGDSLGFHVFQELQQTGVGGHGPSETDRYRPLVRLARDPGGRPPFAPQARAALHPVGVEPGPTEEAPVARSVVTLPLDVQAARRSALSEAGAMSIGIERKSTVRSQAS